MSRRLAGRVVLVTGASRGIGRAAALAIAAEGGHVILLARSVAAMEEVDDAIRAMGGAATLVKLDLRKGDQVDAIGPSIFQRWGRLDGLLANAGTLGPLSPLPHVTTDAWRDTLEINLGANWRLIRTLDPLLRRSDAGRGVFITSGAASAKNAYWGPYAVSKAALEALVKTYAHEMATTAVRVNLLNPGPIRTDMRAKAFPGEDPATLPSPEELVPLILELLDPALTDNGTLRTFQRQAARP
jgi:NAD(P)-dependent dehydrogenase (short-subunit alcohol dehydrogenase family)